jgi:putative oxidoreductase
VATYLVGALELLGGLLLVVGLFTRPAAVLLALNLVGAIATAGRVDGGTFHLGVAPAMLVAMLFLVWAGSGRLALDRAMRVRLAT